MESTSFVRWLKSDCGHSRAGRMLRRKSACRQSFVPRLDALEDRTLPSTFSVLKLDDSGPGSLRQAILDANDLAGLKPRDILRIGPVKLMVELPGKEVSLAATALKMALPS